MLQLVALDRPKTGLRKTEAVLGDTVDSTKVVEVRDHAMAVRRRVEAIRCVPVIVASEVRLLDVRDMAPVETDVIASMVLSSDVPHHTLTTVKDECLRKRCHSRTHLKRLSGAVMSWMLKF